jgi:hypothetical protein
MNVAFQYYNVMTTSNFYRIDDMEFHNINTHQQGRVEMKLWGGFRVL